MSERPSRDELSPAAAAVAFYVPLVPPGVNHYARHTRAGAHYQTGEAKAFKEAVAVLARGRGVRFESYAVCIAVYLAKGQRLDCDGGLKVTIDALEAAGVIDTDARVGLLVAVKGRRPEMPGVELMVCSATNYGAVAEWMEARH